MSTNDSTPPDILLTMRSRDKTAQNRCKDKVQKELSIILRNKFVCTVVELKMKLWN